MTNDKGRKAQKELNQKRRSRQMMLQACLSIALVALLFGNSYAVVKILHGQPVFAVAALNGDDVSSSQPGKEPSAQSGSAAQPDAGENSAPGDEPWNTQEEQQSTINVGLDVTAISSMLAVPSNGKVSLEYFRDALFIGDSVTEGFALYEPLRDIARIYGIRNARPQTFIDNGSVVDFGHNKTAIPAVWDAISAEAPGKIYLMLGTNSIVSSADDEGFLHYYDELLNKIQATFPGVPVYVQGVTPVSPGCAEWNGNYSLTRLHTLNNKIAQLAVSKGCYYVDTHEALADPSTGYLREEFCTSDPKNGMHMLAGAYQLWTEYLQSHTVYSPANLQFVQEGPYT